MNRLLNVLGAVALFGGASLAWLASAFWNWLACENAGTEACARQNLASLAFALATVGLVPALGLVVAAALDKRGLIALALAVGLPLYGVWAIVLDAAVHGWDDLKLVP